MKTADLRSYAAPPEKEAGLLPLILQGAAAFAAAGLGFLYFTNPSALSAVTSLANARRLIASPQVTAQETVAMPRAIFVPERATFTASAEASPAKSTGPAKDNTASNKTLARSAARLSGIPGLLALELADDTAIGADMRDTCLKKAGAASIEIDKNPRAIARFIDCYLTHKPARLCDPGQRRALVEVTGFYATARSYWNHRHEELVKSGKTPRSGDPAPGNWENAIPKTHATGLARLAAQGLISSRDFGETPSADIRAAFAKAALVKPAPRRSACPVTQG